MAHGKILELIEFRRQMRDRLMLPRQKEPRDRSLRGKQRRLARKADNKRPLNDPLDW